MGAIGDPYITLNELKLYLEISPTKTTYDERLTDALQSASGEVEQFCGRQFNRAEVASERQYEPDTNRSITVDDFWTTADFSFNIPSGYTDYSYRLFPLNGVVDGVPGWPYRRIRLSGNSTAFYLGDPSTDGVVTVTAKWGWESVPAPVKQATFLLAAQTFKLADAPFGVTGTVSNEFGGVVRVRDLPQVASKLNRFVSSPILIG